MRHISFAWTVPALIAGRKTCTRRSWKDSYARGFKAGDLVKAYDRSPRYGGQPVAVIRLECNPYRSELLPPSDWCAEGFDYLTEIGATVNGLTPEEFWARWVANGTEGLWVVRFELMAIYHANQVDEAAIIACGKE